VLAKYSLLRDLAKFWTPHFSYIYELHTFPFRLHILVGVPFKLSYALGTLASDGAIKRRSFVELVFKNNYEYIGGA